MKLKTEQQVRELLYLLPQMGKFFLQILQTKMSAVVLPIILIQPEKERNAGGLDLRIYMI
ncbi:hypothetical protein D3C85_1610760 [compost metagenome]